MQTYSEVVCVGELVSVRETSDGTTSVSQISSLCDSMGHLREKNG